MTAETIVDNDGPIVDDSNLDDFEADFFNTPKDVEDVKDTPSDDVKPEESKEVEKEDSSDDDPVEDPDESEEEEAEPPKPKKKTAQERISELANARRKAEQEAEELRKELEALKNKDTPKKTTADTEPTPDDLDDDGEPKYPLGEFDPKYIRDLTKHTLAAEKAAIDAKREQEDKARTDQAARDQLINEWQGKIEEVADELPDFQTKAASLEDTFADIDPGYGEYLATTIMALDAGPQVLYYLAENLDEAADIISMGPVKATLALGRLEASLTKPKVKPKTSDAPPPPPRNRGASAAVNVRGDTDDLEAFEKVFFKK